ncbi:MAG TPA: alpha/beta hydrolase fold domain-containing protein [Mycobacterium sp.]|jgi:acetyl esterase/lipase/ketosteroid isomerase-like protein|nr:alpha/beta hydrolase fold domain-containing protein [Mycobacterium sp.]
MTATEDANKALVIEAFDTLFNRRDYSAAEAFWSPDYIQHSAHIAPGRTGLFELVQSLPAELRYEYQLVVAHGDHVMLHGRFSGHGQPANWIVVDVVRIADGRLAEHWDVIQDEADQTQSVSGLPMFGDAFPAARPPAPPSSLLQAFVAYLRARPTVVDTAGTRDFNDGHAALEGIRSYPSSFGGVPAVTLEPLVGEPERTVVYYHGGGYVSGSPPDRYLPLAGAVALAAQARVHAVDYRLAPEHRFPAAFEDCLATYRGVVRHGGADPQTVAVLGDSAGGNLAVAVTVAARDENLPLPSCVAAISPFADLTFSGASLELRKHADPYVTRELLESMATDYLGGADAADPRCSSVFADLHDLPPLLIQVGEDEILFDDAARIRDAALAAGVNTTFQPWTHGIHVWPVYISAGLPESALAIEALAAFLRLHARHHDAEIGAR